MKKLMALFVTIVMILAMAVPAMATSTPVNQGETQYSDWNGTVVGKKITLNKHMIIKEDGIMPDVTFTYEMTIPEAGKAGQVFINATDTTPVVYHGIELDKIKVLGKGYGDIETGKLLGTLPYDDNDATSGGHKGTSCNLDNHDVPDDFECWTQPITIDFTGVIFTEPGIYRYYLQESSNVPLVENDIEVTGNDNTWRTIDVYVVDNEADSHELVNENGGTAAEPKPVHYIVYEGKLTNAPGTEATTTPEALTQATTWTYVKTSDPAEATDGTYVYKYVDGQWEETYTDNATPPVTTINRNRTTYLMDATGTPAGQTYTPANYGEAVAMGATETQLHGTSWTWIDGTGVVHAYVWDTTVTPANWKHTATEQKAPVNAPHDEATATVKYKGPAGAPDEEKVYTYIEAKANENYIDGELTKYDWVLTDKKADGTAASGTKTTFHWNGTAWEVTEVTENTDAPDAAATPDTAFNVTPVKYSYVSANAKTSNGAEAGKKTNNYKNRFAAYDLEVGKKVTGNQGSRDKYFQFTIEIDASAKKNSTNDILAAGHKITVDRTNMTLTVYDATANYPEYPNAATTHKTVDILQANSNEGKANPSSTLDDVYEIGNDGKVTITVYLHDGEKLVLKDIPEGATYTVTEVDANTEGYKASVEMLPGAGGYNNDVMTNDGANDTNDDKAIDVSDGNKVNDTALMANASVLFTNTRNGVIPTGVAIGVGGAVGLLALAAVYFVLRRKLSVED